MTNQIITSERSGKPASHIYSKRPLFNNIQIPPWEYSAVTLVLVIILNPLITHIGYQMAVNHETAYQEFLEGVELKPYPVTCHCHESDSQGGSTGGCVHTYDVDSYQVYIPEQSHMEKDSDGKGSHKVVDVPAHYETRWRQRPYTTTETTWIIPSTVGEFTVGDHWLPANPDANRLMPEWGQDANDPLDRSLPSGVPAPWSAADARVTSGQPGPVVVEHEYMSYLLASVNTRLRAYSSDIDRYRKAGLLPGLKHDVYGVYYSDALYITPGVDVPNPQDWQYKLAKFNSLLGSTRQGRLYVVVVDANKVSEHETTQYITALTAYWQSPKYFQKWAISKNAIVVAIGAKDGKVAWADASTGMPSGNEAMLYDLQHNLTGTAFTSDSLFGNLTLATTPNGQKFTVSATGDNGAVGKILFGPEGFQRVHMGTLAYLKGDVAITGGEKFGILFFNFLFSLGFWAAIALWAVPAYQDWKSNRSSGRRYYR